MALARLGFQLPDFTRIVWSSPRARDIWQPRLDRMRTAWAEVERLAVIRGIQRVAMQMVSSTGLSGLEDDLVRTGIYAVPLQKCATGQTFTSTIQEAAECSQFLYWTAIGRAEAVKATKAAFEANDQEALCRL